MAQRRIKRVCVLTEALRAHNIDATVFEPFVVAELGGTAGVTQESTEFTVTLENVGGTGTRPHRLLLRWSGASALQGRSPIQGRVMTEWAACGIACAVLWHYTGLRILYSADEGQGFDYWVGGGKQEQGMEISGTLSEEADEIERRHREKRSQLFSALPVGGYVVIVGLVRREIILSYHASEDRA